MTSWSNSRDGAFLDDVDWDKYARFRPAYPASLEKLIIDYHRAHGNSFRLAHDVGSGSGAFAVKLAEYFQHVHVSDPDPTYVEQAKQRLDRWFAEKWWKATFTFSITRAEKSDEPVAEGSVDLATLMECVHWTDQDEMIEAVARSLKPNGTLAVVYYNVTPSVVGNDKVNSAVRRLWESWSQSVVEAKGKDSTLVTKFLPQGSAGVECVPIPDHLFHQDLTIRIDINVHGRGEVPYAAPGHEYLASASRADLKDWRDEYTSEDAKGAGWRYEVDGAWFRGYASTIEMESRMYLHEDRLRDIERLVKETSSNGKVEIEWTVGVLLATRR